MSEVAHEVYYLLILFVIFFSSINPLVTIVFIPKHKV